MRSVEAKVQRIYQVTAGVYLNINKKIITIKNTYYCEAQ